MKSPLYHWLLAFFVTIGLLLSPLPLAAARGMPASDQMMAAEMPGCPGPMTPDECHKCPLMVVCIGNGVASPAESALGDCVAYSTIALDWPGNDSLPKGLGHSPPNRPPRTCVMPA